MTVDVIDDKSTAANSGRHARQRAGGGRRAAVRPAVRRARRRQRVFRGRGDADERDRLWRRQPDGRHRAVRPEGRAVADRAVDLRGQLPPRALFGGVRPAHRRLAARCRRRWPSSSSAIRNLPRPSARASTARRSASPGISAWARRSGCPGSPRPWLGAYFGRLVADPQALGLDFLLPIYFLGLVMSFRKRPLWLPVVRGERGRLGARLQDSSARPGKSRSARWPASLLAAVMPPETSASAERTSKPMSSTFWIILAGAVADLSDPHRRPSRAVALRAHPSARRGRPQCRAGGGADDAGRAGGDGRRAGRA